MSEIKYRGRLRRMIADGETINSESDAWFSSFLLFAHVVLASSLPLADQMGFILAYDDDDMTHQALHMIHQIALNEASPDIIAAFRRPENNALRSRILYTLGWMQHEMIAPFLVALVQAAGDIAIREEAAFLLRSHHHRADLLPPLLPLAQDRTEPAELRSRIIEALFFRRVIVATDLLPFLQDSEAKVRWAALRGLERLGNSFLRPYVEPLINDMRRVNEFELVSTCAKRVLATWERRLRHSQENSSL